MTPLLPALATTAALLARALPAVAPASPPPPAAAGWEEVAPGLEHRLLPAPAEAATVPWRLRVFRADLARWRLAALDPASTLPEGRASASDLRRETGAAVVVNGGFFDEAGRPLGLLVDRGRTLHPLRKADWGVFAVRDGRARLVHTRDFDPRAAPRLDFALQVGPRAVVDGTPTPLKAQVARRAALGVLPDGRVVLAVTEGPPVLSADLAAALALPEARGGLGCRDAVMLDGGGSAQLSARIGELSVDIPGLWTVPTAVALVRRGEGP